MNNKILLEYAKERYTNLNIKATYDDKKEADVYNFKPSDFKDHPTTNDEVKKILGRKWKTTLLKLGYFYNEYKGITPNYLDNPEHNVPILNISCTNKNLISIFKNKMTVSRILNTLKKIKGLVVVNSEFRYGASKSSLNKSRSYAYNKSVEKLVLKMISYLIKNNRTWEAPRGSGVPPLGNTFKQNPKIYDELYHKIKIYSKLRIFNCPDSQCKEILYKKYGKLMNSRIKKIEEMNTNLPSEQKICFDWNISRSKSNYIKKIGIRASSQIASFKVHENNASLYNGYTRDEYLDNKFGKKCWFSYDVHGSIFQVNHVLNRGVWHIDEFDPYREINGKPFENYNNRKIFKSICLPIYFESPRALINHNRFRTPNVYRQYGKKTLINIIQNAQSQMEQFTGPRLDSEIFFHESLIYIDFVYKLRSMGIKVVQVYDGFYMRLGDIYPDKLNDIMQECAIAYSKEYQIWKNLQLTNNKQIT